MVTKCWNSCSLAPQVWQQPTAMQYSGAHSTHVPGCCTNTMTTWMAITQAQCRLCCCFGPRVEHEMGYVDAVRHDGIRQVVGAKCIFRDACDHWGSARSLFLNFLYRHHQLYCTRILMVKCMTVTGSDITKESIPLQTPKINAHRVAVFWHPINACHCLRTHGCALSRQGSLCTSV